MTKRANIFTRIAALVLLVSGITSCAGGGVGLPPLAVVAFNFAPGFAGVRINAPLELTFTSPIDASTITPDSVRIFTTTTTTEQPDPGAPAIFDFPPLVIANVLILKPVLPQTRDLKDSGLRIGFTYTIQVPASPDVIEPVRTVQGDPNLLSFIEFFTTVNSTVLPAPGDNTAEPNLGSLPLFFVDEFGIDPATGTVLTGGIGFGIDPCPRALLPLIHQDSPQVVNTDPDEGEAGFGTITGIQSGLGTAFVRLDPITLEFSEPIGPWRIRAQNITIRNANLGGETFDLFFFFTQDRTHSRLQITVFDADSAFDQASVPQGTYILSLTEFVDLAGNPLIESSRADCPASGQFDLSFSTVSSPALPTDFTLTFEDDGNDGFVDVGGIPTSVTDPNVLPEFMAPFVGGFAVDHVDMPGNGQLFSSANWGNTGLWTGCEVFYSNGYDPATGDDLNIGAQLRLRGGSDTAATAIMAPIAGNATGPGAGGSPDASRPADQRPPALGGPGDPNKIDFFAQGSASIALFTGDANTGPIVYHYARFDLLAQTAIVGMATVIQGVPTLTYRKLNADDSIFPLIIFVEEAAVITGIVDLDGGDGELGFNGVNGVSQPRNPGGLGGLGGAGGGNGGDGGASTLNPTSPEFLNGQTGGVPFNVLGALDELSEAMAGLAGMATGGGGHYNDLEDETAGFVPAYQGGGGAGQASGGTSGADLIPLGPGPDGIFGTADDDPSGTELGAGGMRFGSDATTERAFQPSALFSGGAGAGGGAADDDGIGTTPPDDNGFADSEDDGGGGGGAGGGAFGLACAGTVTLGEIIPNADATLTVLLATIRCVGGRGGSTYANVAGNPVVPVPNQGDPPTAEDPSSPVGQGEAGGGGAGGNVCIIGDQINVLAAEIYVLGKQGGNSPILEGGLGSFRDQDDMGNALTAPIQAGNGGGGVIALLDSDGFSNGELPVQTGGGNDRFFVVPDPLRDVDDDGTADLTDPGPDGTLGTADDTPVDAAAAVILRDFAEMIPVGVLVADIYGDDPREPLFARTVIVSQWFDTLTDFGSYNEVRTLSNAPDFPAGTIRVFLDTVITGAGGVPELTSEQPDGMFIAPEGATYGASLTRNPFPPINTGDPEIGDETGVVQYESRDEGVNAIDAVRRKRFARVRIVFDISLIGAPAALLASFAPPGAPLGPIADDGDGIAFVSVGPDGVLGTADDVPVPGLANTLNNINQVFAGVPAVAELRIKFTPAGNPDPGGP